MRTHWSDSLWHLPLRTQRRCGDMPFVQWTQHWNCKMGRDVALPRLSHATLCCLLDLYRLAFAGCRDARCTFTQP